MKMNALSPAHSLAHSIQRGLDFAPADKGDIVLLRSGLLRSEWQTIIDALRAYAAVPPEVVATKLTDEEIEKLVNMRPGPIQVVYPLDEEWDKAIDAAIEECWRLEDRGKTDHRKSWMGNAAHAILLLRRSPQAQSRSET